METTRARIRRCGIWVQCSHRWLCDLGEPAFPLWSLFSQSFREGESLGEFLTPSSPYSGRLSEPKGVGRHHWCLFLCLCLTSPHGRLGILGLPFLANLLLASELCIFCSLCLELPHKFTRLPSPPHPPRSLLKCHLLIKAHLKWPSHLTLSGTHHPWGYSDLSVCLPFWGENAMRAGTSSVLVAGSADTL